MKECKSGNCLSKATVATLIISVITLIGGAILGTCLHKQVTTLHKAMIEMQFGSAATFEKLFEARMTPETQKQITEQMEKVIESFKNNDSENMQAEEEAPATNGTLSTEQVDQLLAQAHIYNNKKTDVVVIEYADMRCGACKYLHDSKALEELSEENEDTSVAFMAVPLWPESEIGTLGAYCAAKIAGNDAYYQFVDAGFNTRPEDLEAVKSIAQSLGIDAEKFATCVEDPKGKLEANAPFTLARQLFGVDATPTSIVLNIKTGKYEIVGGAVPKAQFEDAVKKVK